MAISREKLIALWEQFSEIDKEDAIKSHPALSDLDINGNDIIKNKSLTDEEVSEEIVKLILAFGKHAFIDLSEDSSEISDILNYILANTDDFDDGIPF